MKLFIGNQRKDGKYPVTHAYDNGKRIKKLYTAEKLQRLAIENKTTNQYEIINGRL